MVILLLLLFHCYNPADFRDMLNDVVAGNINEKLVKKLKTNYPELAAFPENIDYVRNKKKFSFYIQNGKAIVCLQPYALVGQGGQYRILGLKLK